MAQTGKILGQLVPTANTLSSLYTVPSATWSVVSNIMICTNSQLIDNWSIKLVKSGDSDDNKQFIFNQIPLDGYDTFVNTFPITLNAGDSIKVLSVLGSTTFTALGVENS
jgi:hypothetical protein